MDTVRRPSAEVTQTSRTRGIRPEGGLRPEGSAPLSGPERERLRVLIVSDVRLYREGLADLLGRISKIAVVGAAGSADEGIGQVQDLQPDVVLLDTGTRGVAAAYDLLRQAPDTRVVALAAPESAEDVIALAEAGVLGYVTREQSLDDLVTTIESVARDEMVCSPWMATVLARRVQALAADRPPSLPGLTAREVEILELVAQGLSNKEIAARLYIEVTTVKNHMHNILGKLGVRRREEAAARMRVGFSGKIRLRTGPLAFFAWQIALASQIAQEIQI